MSDPLRPHRRHASCPSRRPDPAKTHLRSYADICVEHLNLPDSAVINYTDMESMTKVAAGLTALRDAVPDVKEESSSGLFPAPHSPVSIPSRMRRAVSESEGPPRVSSPLRASGWASSPAKIVGAVSASVANMGSPPPPHAA